MEYKAQYQEYLRQATAALDAASARFLPEESEVCRAARYSLLGGGKRIRAILTLSVCDMLGGEMQVAAQFAAAVEMLHCYSLIHDDLPCMDNDDFRRGRPSCHKQFGESTALLAADALVTAAFEVIAHADLPAESRVEAAAILAKGGGARGMLYGQELDKHYETIRATEDQLLELHRNKTGALIIVAVELGLCDGLPDCRRNRSGNRGVPWFCKASGACIPDRGRHPRCDLYHRRAGQARRQRCR